MQNYYNYLNKDIYTAIGIMSGTSVDGLDIAAAEFIPGTDSWKYRIVSSESVEYPEELRLRLLECIGFSGEQLAFLDMEFGKFIGEHVSRFCKDGSIRPDLIASHGHTVFHQPAGGLTMQIGDGCSINNITGILTVNDFRKGDVLLGGQGAPLVPVGDKLLFPESDFCLNIGGFANISFDDASGQRMAYDVAPANILLNYLARKSGKKFDAGGQMAATGNVIRGLQDNLNSLDFYSGNHPKSLGLEWLKANVLKIIDRTHGSTQDLMRTSVEHIALQIHAAVSREIHSLKNRGRIPCVLVTGGGVYNRFLIDRLRSMAVDYIIEIPDREIINFKEALIFAFLGVLRVRNEVNILKSVTGASHDSCGGTIYDSFGL